jgi:hypothetical protein
MHADSFLAWALAANALFQPAASEVAFTIPAHSSVDAEPESVVWFEFRLIGQ